MRTPASANRFMLFFTVYSVIIPLLIGILFLRTDINIEPVLLLANHIIMFGIPILLLMLVCHLPLSRIAPFRPLDIKNILLVVGITIFSMPIMNLVATISSIFTENQVGDAVYEYLGEYPFWLCFVSTAVMPAIFEELVFRGIILNGYKVMGIGISAAMSALFFGIMHMDAHQFFYATAIGIVLAMMVYYSGSIYTSMLAHFLINGSQLILVKAVYLMGMEDNVALSEELTMQDKLSAIAYDVFILLVTLPVFVALMVAFIRHNKGKNREYVYDMSPEEISEMLNGHMGIIDFSLVLVIVIFLLYIVLTNI